MNSSVPQCCLDLLTLSLLSSASRLALGSSGIAESALNELHTNDKKIEHVDNIMVIN